jgi:hypothetical protein
VADWRLKDPVQKEEIQPGVLEWKKFNDKFAIYWKDEPEWRKELIHGNVKYYSTGILPACLPRLPEGLPAAVVSEAVTGKLAPMKEQKR